MLKCDILCEENYLHIPIIPGGKRNDMQIWAGNRLLYTFCVALTDEGGEYFFFNVSEYQGKKLTIIIPEPDGISQQALARIINGADATVNNPLYQDLYQEPLRPSFHFSSKRGWLNDPNGLFYADGSYHMYYQHNPLGTPHGGVNICWGHAISSDLIHWEEQEDAILPWRRDWSIASGSAVIDYENRAGYGKNAVIAAFTVLGTPNIKTGIGYPSGGQYLAASTDGGYTFYRFSHDATVPTKNGYGWRDPRLFRYEDHYVMAVYETDEFGQDCVSFYVSDDFHKWTIVSKNENLYECPDIFPLEVVNHDERIWVLYGADGMARIGNFDGYHFVESGLSNPLDYGNASYAGQTFSHHPDNKIIHTSWVRGMGGEGEDLGYENMPFSQCMSFPCEITVKRINNKLHVCRTPIPQIDQLRKTMLEDTKLHLEAETKIPLNNPAQYMFKITDLTDNFSLRVGSHIMKYNRESKRIQFENGHYYAFDHATLEFMILVDTTTMEICFDHAITSTYAMPPEHMSIILKGNCSVSYQCYELNTIWNM